MCLSAATNRSLNAHRVSWCFLVRTAKRNAVGAVYASTFVRSFKDDPICRRAVAVKLNDPYENRRCLGNHNDGTIF